MYRKGFTLIELLAVIVILAVIALIATPIILGIIDDSKKNAFKATAYGISQSAKNAFVEIMYAGEEPKNIVYTYTDGVESSSPDGYILKYEGNRPKNGKISLTQEGKVSLIIYDGKYCATKDFDEAEVIIEDKSLDECLPPPPIDSSGANAPVLTAGMTAVIWNGSSWIVASDINDPAKQNWYDYANKKWANARTADGSLWVWIPRYAYQITTGYHTNTAGEIRIKFLKDDTNVVTDGSNTPIEATPTYSGNSQTNYIKHPSFWWDNDNDDASDTGEEITGMWVAKFEMSGSTTLLDSKPGVASLRSTSVANIFNSSRNMETNSRYGWGVSGTDIDTHALKATEWGMIVYLAQSTYGKNAEVWINPSISYLTGCAGTAAIVAGSSGCSYTYETANGQQASTTGNIYGVYDMSGNAWEYVMANYNNTQGSAGINPTTIANKYINRYMTYTSTMIGDATYETSSDQAGANSWYGDHAYMPSSGAAWVGRGGTRNDGVVVGIYYFNAYTGQGDTFCSWRTAIVVGTGF